MEIKLIQNLDFTKASRHKKKTQLKNGLCMRKKIRHFLSNLRLPIILCFGLFNTQISVGASATNSNNKFQIIRILNNEKFELSGGSETFAIGQNVLIVSKTPDVGVIGFASILDKKNQSGKNFESSLNSPIYTAQISKVSQYNLIQIGDEIVTADLSQSHNSYLGSTELLARMDTGQNISLRYRPLYTQGPQIGETAQTLWHLESFITWYGLMAMGLGKRFTISTLAPANFFGIYNFSGKLKIWDSSQNTVSTGLSLTKPKDSERWTLNLTLMWDAFSSQNTVSHTFATLAVYQIERAEDRTAIKAAGTSSLQTGYEFILGNWDRVLLGPNYNFETKNIGGYLAYKMLWDIFALELSLYSTNVRRFEYDPENGYSGFFDAYWRF